MKVGNNIIKTGMFCLIVVLAAVCGYFVGNHQDINSGEDNKKEAEDKFDRRLAVVNMDEGAMQGEEKIYYASQLLPYSGADYTVTGLQDARNGIEIGLYSAYIVIPADFSRSVNSLNEQPAVSRLEYTIAGDLNTAQKEMTAREIERMAENMNDSLTKVYLSSVMQEFHEVQDAGAVILSNDQKDKELLDAVNAGSLIELVEMPGPVRVENDVNPLNLSSVYETDETLTGELGAAYQRFLQEGQSSVEQTKERAGAVSEDMTQVYAAFETANSKLAGMDIAAEVPENEEVFQQTEDAVRAAMDAYNAYLEEYNRSGTEGDISYLEAVKEYEETETAYQNMLSSFLREDPDLCYRYVFFNQPAYIEELAKILEADIGVVTDTFPDQAYNSWQQYLEECTKAMDENKYMLRQEMIPNVEYGEETSGNPPVSSEKVKTLDEALTEEPDAESTSEIIIKEVESLVNHSKEDRKMLVEKSEEKRDELIAAYSETTGRYLDMSAANAELNEEWNSYDLNSYVDENEVADITASITVNHQEMENSVAEYTGDYDKYVSDVYEASADHLTAVQEKVSEAEKESERLLTEGLEAAKASRNESSEQNLELLGDFSAKLPFTRIGNVENKEVYDFIAAPLMLQEKEQKKEQKKQDNTGTIQENPDQVQDYSAANRKAVWGGLLLLVGGISLALLGRQGINMYQRKKAEEF